MAEPYADVTFAGYLFVRSEGFVLLGEPQSAGPAAGGIQLHSTFAMPLEGAFLMRVERGWRFVAGPHLNQPFPWRHVVEDLDADGEGRAEDLAALGDIPVLSVDDAQANVQRYGRPLQLWLGWKRAAAG